MGVEQRGETTSLLERALRKGALCREAPWLQKHQASTQVSTDTRPTTPPPSRAPKCMSVKTSLDRKRNEKQLFQLHRLVCSPASTVCESFKNKCIFSFTFKMLMLGYL